MNVVSITNISGEKTVTECPNCKNYTFSFSERRKMVYRWRRCPKCDHEVRLSQKGLTLIAILVVPLVALGLNLLWIFAGIFWAGIGFIVFMLLMEFGLVKTNALIFREKSGKP